MSVIVTVTLKWSISLFHFVSMLPILGEYSVKHYEGRRFLYLSVHTVELSKIKKKNNYIQNANVEIYIRHRIVLLFLVSKLIPIFCFDWWSNSLKMNKNHLWIKVAYNKRTAFACISYWMRKINGQNGARLIQNFCNCNKSSAMPKTILVWLSPFLAAQMLRILNKKI